MSTRLWPGSQYMRYAGSVTTAAAISTVRASTRASTVMVLCSGSRRVSGVGMFSSRGSSYGRPAVYGYNNSSSSKGSSNPSSFPVTPSLFLLSLLGLGLINFAENRSESHCAPKADKKSAPLDHTTFTAKLKSELEKVRARLKRPDGPKLAVGVQDSTHQVSIDTTVKIDTISLLLYWSQILGNDVDVTTNVTGAISSHALVGGDKKSSLVLSTSPSKSSATLFKEGGFSLSDLDYIVQGYEKALTASVSGPAREHDDHGSDPIFRIFSGRPGGFVPIEGGDGETDPWGGMGANSRRQRSAQDPIATLKSMGVEVYDKSETDGNTLTWENLAGYTEVKEMIEDTIVLSVLHPDIYDDIVQKTRMTFESNRPKAVLLEGPPGTGKTLTARILAQRCDRPLVHLRLESIVDKYFGESEKKLAKIFDACDQLDGAVIFIDEVDALASSRDRSEMHEATRRMLSVILQRIEGFQGRGKSLLLCATNRKQDLDAALLSRFDLSIKYELPNYDTRKAVFARYSKQFVTTPKKGVESPLDRLATASHGMSCRDIKEACQNAERRWASKRVKQGRSVGDVPTLEIYLDCLRQRTEALSIGTEKPSEYSA
jgi:hypothetical protein